MEKTVEEQIKSTVLDWATKNYRTTEIVIGSVTPAGLEDYTAEDDGAERYLVVYAVRVIGRWLVAEVWINEQQILSVNDLGEGLPLDDIRWPWVINESP